MAAKYSSQVNLFSRRSIGLSPTSLWQEKKRAHKEAHMLYLGDVVGETGNWLPGVDIT
jgi:hypothetical protein